MSIEQALIERSNNQCELCAATDNLSVYEVPPVTEAHSDKCIYVCQTCKDQIENNAGNDTRNTPSLRCDQDPQSHRVLKGQRSEYPLQIDKVPPMLCS